MTMNTTYFPGCIVNTDPLYNNEDNYDFHLQANSPAINLGLELIATVYLKYDYDHINRFADGLPDAGVFEYVKKP